MMIFLCLTIDSLLVIIFLLFFFFFNDTATTEIYTLSLHDALPIWTAPCCPAPAPTRSRCTPPTRSEEHTSELQSPVHLVCRLLLEKKKKHIQAPALLNITEHDLDYLTINKNN